jgi:hypothetical protein
MATRNAASPYPGSNQLSTRRLRGWVSQWQEWWCVERPVDLPRFPDIVYAGEGWRSWDDWFFHIRIKERAGVVRRLDS